MLEILEIVTIDVLEADADPLVKGRCAGYLLGIALKAIEVSDFEERIECLEETLGKRNV